MPLRSVPVNLSPMALPMKLNSISPGNKGVQGGAVLLQFEQSFYAAGDDFLFLAWRQPERVSYTPRECYDERELLVFYYLG